MELFIKHSTQLFITLFICVSTFLTSTPVEANQFIKNSEDLEKQRQIFGTLINEGKLGKVNPEDYRSSLGSYPLFAYLEYLYLLNRIGSVNLEEYENFFQKNESLASSSYLRKQLLIYLGNKKDWENFKRFYKEPEYFFSESSVVDLICFSFQSEISERKNQLLLNDTITETNNIILEESQNKDIQSLYLTGESLPDSCDPVIEVFEK